MQAPATQAAFVHATALPQAPFALHVCTPLPEHCVNPCGHTPVHPPATHVWLPQAIAAPHWPDVPHICTPLPEHCVVPGVQGTALSGDPSVASGAPSALESGPAWASVGTVESTAPPMAPSPSPPLLPA
jgi:hypothetical protein